MYGEYFYFHRKIGQCTHPVGWISLKELPLIAFFGGIIVPSDGLFVKETHSYVYE